MKQQRDSKGRFLPFPKEKTYTLNDIERAFYAGLNATGGYTLPSRKWEFYKRLIGEKE